MTDTVAKRLCFADCELDPASRELRRAGELVALEPRVFALLVYLIEQRRRAVDKDEIQDVVWKGRIVSETALTRAIMKARRAVGDSPEKQAVIRTLHGHGYQFVATLTESGQASTATGETTPSQLTTPRLLAALVVLFIVGFIVYLWPGATSQEVVRLAIMPVQNATSDTEYDWTRLGLMGFANDLLTRDAKLNILPASDVMRFAERKTRLRSKDDEDTEFAAADLEQLRDSYGATHMLVSTLIKNASGLRLTYVLYMPGGEAESSTMVDAEPTALMRGTVRSVGELLDDQVPGIDEISVVSEDPFINEAYSRGLGLSLEGRCSDAQKLFEVVIASSNTAGRAEYEWATCARILGHWQVAEAGFEELLKETPIEPASTLRAMALSGLGSLYLDTGRRDAARDTFARGLAEAQQAGDFLMQGKLLNSLAIDAKNRGEYTEARELLARAALAHTEAGAGALPGQLPAALANIDMAEGKLDRADENLDAALIAYRAIGDRRNEAMMLNNIGYLRRLQDRTDEAEPFHLRSLEIRREIGDRVGQGRILGMLSILYEDDGRFEDAKAAASEAYGIASEANDRLFMATGLAQLASAEERLENIDAARLAYADSKAIFEQIDDYSRVAQIVLRLARMDLKNGETAAAEKSTHEVLSLALREALHEPAIEAMELSGDIALQQSDPDRAVAAYEKALSHIDQTGFISRKSKIVTKLANTFLDLGNVSSTEPLIGYMIEQGDLSTADAQTLARYRKAKEQ